MGVFALGCAVGCSDRRAAAEAPNHEASVQTAAQPVSTEGLPVDLSPLHDDEKASFEKLIQQYPSACGKPHSLLVSVKTDPKCKRSVFAMRYIARLLAAHLLPSEVEEHYDLRFGPQPRVDIDVSKAPLRGEAHAPVTIVEFSDFQCPHCKHLQPALEQILSDYRGQVRVYFKNYPIERAHPDAKLAAQAALAAGKQGKFWEFHDKLFRGDQEHEDMGVLEKYAKELKLNIPKWKGDIDGFAQQVAQDHSDGEKLNVSATPTMYINGRLYRGPNTYDEIKDWIEEELNK